MKLKAIETKKKKKKKNNDGVLRELEKILLLTQVFVVLGGLLSDPINGYPRIFGPHSPLGGAEGARWLESFPYALPMVLNFFFLMLCAFLVGVGLDEVRALLALLA